MRGGLHTDAKPFPCLFHDVTPCTKRGNRPENIIDHMALHIKWWLYLPATAEETASQNSKEKTEPLDIEIAERAIFQVQDEDKAMKTIKSIKTRLVKLKETHRLRPERVELDAVFPCLRGLPDENAESHGDDEDFAVL